MALMPNNLQKTLRSRNIRPSLRGSWAVCKDCTAQLYKGNHATQPVLNENSDNTNVFYRLGHDSGFESLTHSRQVLKCIIR
jgi:hypothetical protein